MRLPKLKASRGQSSGSFSSHFCESHWKALELWNPTPLGLTSCLTACLDVTLGLTFMAVLCPPKALAMLHRLAHEGCCPGTCSVTIMGPEVGCPLSSASQMEAGKESGGRAPDEGMFAPVYPWCNCPCQSQCPSQHTLILPLFQIQGRKSPKMI